MARGHYLLIVLPDGKDHVRREYVPLEHTGETADEALDRYVLEQMRGRVRNRAKTEARLRDRILYTRICRPSSWIRAQKEQQ